jgi:hypothetical protein
MSSFTPPTSLSTPVLFIVFNRPDTTRQVFEEIRKAKPQRLYVAADGPRKEVASDKERCEQVRAIVQQVDWDCKSRFLFRDTNLNCGVAPSTAITWFFEQEDEGIILEDDCLPAPSFFLYCQELLERYRYDSRVMHIGGNNFLNGWRKDHDYSYYFSRAGHVWGWATWRRAWAKFDFDIRFYETLKGKGFFRDFFLNRVEKLYRLRKFNATATCRGRINWWDYQWDFARYIHSGLAFDQWATHTTNGNSTDAKLDAHEITLPLRHPPFMIRDAESDRRYINRFIKGILVSKFRSAFT